MATRDRDDRSPRSGPSRRQVLVGTVAALTAASGTVGVLALLDDPRRSAPAPSPTPSRTAPARPGALPTVAPLEAPPDRAAFAPEEQRCAPYLVALAAIANSVDDSTTDRRGFVSGGWWREPAEPFNARTCEVVHTFGWFAAHRRPWNPYAGDDALLARTDAVLDRYLGLQHADGSWPELDPDERSRAATAFALGYLSKTLADLRAAQALPEQHARVVEAVRRGARWFLDPANDDVWRPEVVELSNQVLAAFTGTALALRQDPDDDLAALLADRVAFAAPRIQSPAGFLYEPRGMDVAYNVSVSLAEIAELHRTLGAAPLLPLARRLAGWLGLVTVPEPDGAGLVVLDSAAARTTLTAVDGAGTDGDPRDPGALLAEHVPALRPLYATAETRAEQRRAWAADPDPVAPVEPGGANPRVVANLTVPEGLPSAADRAAATAAMPAPARTRFTDLRRDPQRQDYLFVRRPAYYVAAFHGTRPTARTRTGLGLLWHPVGGTFVQAVGGGTATWGADLPDGTSEGASDTEVSYDDGSGGSPLGTPDAVAAATTLGVASSTADGRFRSRVTFDDAGLTRVVTTGTAATEQVPLLLRDDDDVRWADGSPATDRATTTALVVRRGATALRVGWDVDADATLTVTERSSFRGRVRRLRLLRVPFVDRLSVRYDLAGG